MAALISAIIPAYNEADIIEETIKAVLKIPEITQLIVVDDASTDGTSEAADRAGAHQVIRLSKNVGKGGALNKGFSLSNGSIIILLDADLGSTAIQAYRLLQPVLDNSADMTIGQFNAAADDPQNKLASRSKGFGTAVKIARAGIKLLAGSVIYAPLSGQRALNREIIEKAGGFASGFGIETALTIDALRMGYRVIEVPVDMKHRATGRDFRGFMHRGKQFAHILRIIIWKAICK